MDTRALYHQMTQYHQWRQKLNRRLGGFEQWIQDHGFVSDEVRQCLKGARQLLDNDSFTLVCVGEFSRGKTELINALLMGDQPQRILPSQPGRTTMCPTEIYCDPKYPNCVRLLPIETRRSRVSLQSFKRIPQNWVTVPFDPESPDQMRAALGQVCASRWVTPEEAQALGFDAEARGERDHEGRVAVPNWRHALISLDHPLLRRGLRIIDTPGLNALGNEPELTLKVLPQAQAIIFLLAADAGVTASDLTLWRDHIQDLTRSRGTAVLTLLNKVDSLWDDLYAPEQTRQMIQTLCQQTARQLELDNAQVLPLSAKHALLARARRQEDNWEKSGFPQLEQALAHTVERNRKQLEGHRQIVDSQAMITNVHQSLERHLADAEEELQLVRASTEKDNSELIRELRETIRTSHRQYHKQALSLRTSQMLLEKQRPALTQAIHMSRLQSEIEATRRRLGLSWTTVGLSRVMAELFDWLDSQMGHLEREVERANRVLSSIYQRPEHGTDQSQSLQQHLLDIEAERRQLRQLQQRADQFRASLNSVLSLKPVLIERFIGTLVSEARELWQQLNRQVDDWLAQGLAPLFHQNQYQRQLLEHHMLRLTRMQTQQQSHTEQVRALRVNIHEVQLALEQLHPLVRPLPSVPGPEQPAPEQNEKAAVVSLDAVREAQLAQ